MVAVPAVTPVTRPLPLTVATAALLVAHVTARPLSAVPAASRGVAVSCPVWPTGTLDAAGLTATDATGTFVTVTVAEPFFPSLVAVMVAVPAVTPVTRPLPLTVATAVLLVAHVTARPLSAVPPASWGVAVSCPVWPTGTLDAAGLTATDATGTFVTVTVTVAVPFFPSLVAVMVAVPAVTPVTRPLPLTVATAVLLVAHVTARPLSAVPPASWGVAVSCPVWPTGTLDAAGLTTTDATGTFVTVTVAEPFFPSLVAVMVAVPAVTPVTRPLPLTVATAALLVAHVTARPLSAVPPASRGVAVSCPVWPTGTLDAAGLTATDATGTFVTVTVAEPFFPSLVAVMVAVPATTPVTRPLPLTVATAVLLVAHVTARPLSAVPPASWGVAASCIAWPICRLGDAGLTATDATGTCVTVTMAVSEGPAGCPVTTIRTFPVSGPAW